MVESLSRKSTKGRSWPHIEKVGRETVRVYRRKMPNGSFGYRVENYSGPKRRLDSYADEAQAIEAAKKLARHLSQKQTLAAQMTQEQAVEYSDAVLALAPYGVSVRAIVGTVAECLKIVGTLPSVMEAVTFFAARRKQTVAERVEAVVTELLTVKANRGASERYIEDLRHRLNVFAKAVKGGPIVRRVAFE